MRLYSWVMGLYLNDKQHGIQTTHAMCELTLKYKCDVTIKDKLFWEWISKHKTICLLDAKNYRGLLNLVDMFDTVENPYPWGTFNEDYDSLGGLMTCVSIVLPERIYGRTKELPDCSANGVRVLLREEGYTEWEIELMLKLPTYRLA